jgi:hypothetical protein
MIGSRTFKKYGKELEMSRELQVFRSLLLVRNGIFGCTKAHGDPQVLGPVVLR